MATTSIPLSKLSDLASITNDDYFPIGDSGSVTTFKAPISVLNTWFSTYGTSSRSINSDTSSMSITSSWASSSLSASYARSSSISVSASYAGIASQATSASYANAISNGGTILNTGSVYYITSSWASSSISSSRTTTASFAITSSNALTSSYAITSSNALTASYAVAAGSTGVSVEVPIGGIIDFAGSTPPPNFVLCDGALYDTATYAAAFAVLGYTWGGAASNFAVPNLIKRTTIGANGVLTKLSGSLGNTGGGEGFANHWHGVGGSSQGYWPDGSSRNDDPVFLWIEKTDFDLATEFPLKYTPSGVPYGYFYMVGGAGNIYQPAGVYTGIASLCLGTTFPRTDGVSTNDSAFPYATVNKIIRLT